MQRVVVGVAGLVLAALGIAGPALAAEAVFPPGSRIGLVPPPSMRPAPGMAGFQDPKTGAAIMAIEMPAEAYPSVAASLTDEALKTQGFTLKSREATKVGALDGMIVAGDQAENGRAIPKQVLLAADPTVTALVVAQFPPGAPAGIESDVHAALKTVVLRPPLSMEEQLASLPFRLGDTAGFRPLRVMAGNALLLTDGPSDVVRQAEQPILIVAQSMVPAPPAEQRDAFARALLSQNTFLKDIVLERSQAFRQDGADWQEIVAKAKDGHSDEPVVVMQTLRFEPTGYLRTVGVVRTDQRDAILPRFRRVVDATAPR